MDDTWASRDLPVLESVVAQLDELLLLNGHPDAVDVAGWSGWPVEEVIPALNALDGEYINLHRTLEPEGWYVTGVTARARRAVGQWPSGENLIERLSASISEAAEQEKDPAQKRRLLSVARELGGAAKTIAINVATEMLEHRLPH
jgi:hypothetical protein